MKIVKLLLSTLLLSGVVFGATCSENFSEPVPYVVQKGDWLSKISISAFSQEEMMEGVEAIVKMNGIQNPELIFPGQVIIIPCLANKLQQKKVSRVFVPVETSHTLTTSALVLKSELPSVDLGADFELQAVALVSLPEFVMQSDSPVEKQQEEVVVAKAIPQIQFPVQAVSTETKAKPGKKNKVKMIKAYQDIVSIPDVLAQGIHEGFFPAVLAEGQNKNGFWTKRTDLGIEIKKDRVVEAEGVTATFYNVFVILDKKPESNASIWIDFQNGYGFPLLSKHLDHIAAVEVVRLPQKFPKGSYVDLYTSLPKKESFLLGKVVRPAITYGPAIAMGAVTMNPYAFVSIGTGITARHFAKKKQDKASPPPLQVQYALTLQSDEIETLKGQVEMLKKQLESLQQNPKQLQLAQNKNQKSQ